MNPIIQWILKEYRFFLKELPNFLGYYTMRDRIPFYTFFSYLLNKHSQNLFSILCSEFFMAVLYASGIISFYGILSGLPTDVLMGFEWNYLAPLLYIIQILILAHIGLEATNNITYGLALGFNGAVATGYIYEMPYWVYSIKSTQANFLHTSYRYVFYINFQIISIGVFLWLLKEQKIIFNIKDLYGFIIVFGISIFLASKMYEWKTWSINRIPMMTYIVYLASKINNSFLTNIVRKFTNLLHRIEKIPYYFSSRKKIPELAKGKVACVMCVWDEQIMVPYALESSKDFVSKYIIVDKNGKTLPIIEKCAKQWNLNIETYIKSNMSLREARLFAISKINEPWILIQDGDEVFHTDGPYSIIKLRRYMNRPNRILCTKMTVLIGDFNHTRKNNPIQPSHKFLYHNNGTIHAGKNLDNIPDGRAWIKTLPGIWKFNCVIKQPRRHYLRKFWDQWCMKSNSYKTYPNIEDYVTKELGINIDEEYMEWYKQRLESFGPYNEKQLGYYPEIIRRELY